ncbi:hypothetical protein EYF80_022329 [Liparis tanakae]|uniref:Uncharacterized protein n=1 Tax=Liparis tanakae TaxID=230148 RepID=A0A4Z2HQX2_9TELE|nr:hypothetical protein EYF80_022329 [Liparis tanakae]
MIFTKTDESLLGTLEQPGQDVGDDGEVRHHGCGQHLFTFKTTGQRIGFSLEGDPGAAVFKRSLGGQVAADPSVARAALCAALAPRPGATWTGSQSVMAEDG